MSDTIYYAIGDVHGEIEKLEALLGFISDDARASKAASKIVFLGDLIDRGPDSRAVVERAMLLTQCGKALTIKGNHEEMMLNAYITNEMSRHSWADNGGEEAVASYNLVNGFHQNWRDAIDRAHIAWLRSLPDIVRDEPRGLVFVHAGIDTDNFPECGDGVRLWTRSNKFFDVSNWPRRPELKNLLVVHGHTPTLDQRPHVSHRRINVDTGACYGGPLTAVVLAPGEGPRFLSA